MRADGATITANSGDWLIYPDPQITEGELPNTLTTETNDNIDTLYTLL
jgi:hypothetical protein